MLSISSTKPLYPSSSDPDLLSGGAKYVAAASNSCPPPHILEKHFTPSASDELHPRFNPLNKSRPRSSALLNINDSMAMHLLVETAIVDSNEYEVLSYEEVEDLKKEYNFLANRIEASKRKLALESKVRDAALSLSRLYSKKGKNRRSFLGGMSDVTKHTDEELMSSNRKCEELSQELWRLNNRAMEIQKRLLQHGAGILGLTHQGGIKPLLPVVQRNPLPPGSPSSSYNYTNGKGGMTPVMEDEFDDRSLYRTPDKLGDFGNYDRQLFVGFSNGDRRSSQLSGGQRASNASNEDVHTTRRLEDLNNQLRDTLLQTTSSQALPPPPHLPIHGPIDAPGLHEQLSLLEKSVQFIQQNPPPSAPYSNPGFDTVVQNLERTEAILSTLWDMLIAGEEEVRSQKAARMQNGASDQDYQDSENEQDEITEFTISAFSAKVQALYTRNANLRSERDALRQTVSGVQRGFDGEVQVLNEHNRSKVEELSHELTKMENQLEQLAGLAEERENDIVHTNNKMKALVEELKATQAEAQEKREEARLARDEIAAVMQQLDIERRKSQQRSMEGGAEEEERNSAELNAEIQARAEAEEVFIKQIQEKEDQLAELANSFDEMKEDRDIARAELDALAEETETSLKKLEKEIASLKESRRTLEEASVQQEGLLRAEIGIKEKQLQKMDSEMRELEGKVAELSMEVAMLKAELDEAYGSRKQRSTETAQARAAAAALEAAANKQPQVVDPGLLGEIDNLAIKNHSLMEEIARLKAERSATIPIPIHVSDTSNLERRCKLLQAELDGMLVDFENLTKQSIEFEKERSALENLIDGLRDRCEGLETSLADEKVRWMGMRNANASAEGMQPGLGRYRGDGIGESTSINVLKSEFKKMMRDMRSEQLKTLRAEQEERRKLEGVIRTMKKEHQQRRGTMGTNRVPSLDATR